MFRFCEFYDWLKEKDKKEAHKLKIAMDLADISIDTICIETEPNLVHNILDKFPKSVIYYMVEFFMQNNYFLLLSYCRFTYYVLLNKHLDKDEYKKYLMANVALFDYGTLFILYFLLIREMYQFEELEDIILTALDYNCNKRCIGLVDTTIRELVRSGKISHHKYKEVKEVLEKYSKRKYV